MLREFRENGTQYLDGRKSVAAYHISTEVIGSVPNDSGSARHFSSLSAPNLLQDQRLAIPVAARTCLTPRPGPLHSLCYIPVGFLPGGPCAFSTHGASYATARRNTMKRIALFAVAGLVLAACAAKEEAPKMDTTAAAPAAAMDTTVKVDSPPPMAAPTADTTKH